MLKKVLLFLYAIILASYLSSPVAAFVIFTDDVNTWQDDPLVFDYNFTDCDSVYDRNQLLASAQEALSRWSVIPGSRIRLKLGNEVSRDHVQMRQEYNIPHNPVIVCDDQVSTNLFPNADPDSITFGGWGAVWSVDSTFKNGYVVLNIDPSTPGGQAMRQLGASYNQRSMDRLLSHEVGHVLGFAHSGDTDSIMNYTPIFELGQDDFDGARYLYPEEEEFNNMLGCGEMDSNHSKQNLEDGLWQAATFLYFFPILPLFFGLLRRLSLLLLRKLR